MKTLYLDCATTRWHTDKRTGEEPRIVRIAWAYDDAEPTSYVLKLPDGCTIDPSTHQYHGVSVETASLIGGNPPDVLPLFRDWAGFADDIAAYNGIFHFRQIDRGLSTHGLPALPDKPRVCVMDAMAPICRIPPTRGSAWKSPSLAEAYVRATGSALALPDDPEGIGIGTINAVRRVHRFAIGVQHAAGTP